MNFVPVPTDFTDDELLEMLGRDLEVVPKRKSPERPDAGTHRMDSRVRHEAEARAVKMMPSIDELDELEEEIMKPKTQVASTMDIEKRADQKPEQNREERSSTGNFERTMVSQPADHLKYSAQEMIFKATHKVWKTHPEIRPFSVQDWKLLASEKGYHKVDHIFLFIVQYEVMNDIVVLDLSDSKELVRSSMPRSSFLLEDPIADREVNFESFYRIFQPKEDLYFMNGTKLWTGVVLWIADATLIYLGNSEETNYCLVLSDKNLKGVFEPSLLN